MLETWSTSKFINWSVLQIGGAALMRTQFAYSIGEAPDNAFFEFLGMSAVLAVMFYLLTLSPLLIAIALLFRQRWVQLLVVFAYFGVAIGAYFYALYLASSETTLASLSATWPAHPSELAAFMTIAVVGCILTITEVFTANADMSR